MTDHADAIATVAHILRLNAVTEREAGEPSKATELESMAATLTVASAEMERLQDMVSPLPASIGNIRQYPDKLRVQLSKGKIDRMDEKIIAVINAREGEADLDQILVGLYLKFEIIERRRYLQSKLYRLSRLNVVAPVPGKAGAFRTTRFIKDAVDPLLSEMPPVGRGKRLTSR